MGCLKFVEERPRIPFDYAQRQALESPLASSTPKSKDRSLGTPVLESVWGPVRSLMNGGLKTEVQTQILRLTTPNLHPSDEDLSLGTPAKLRSVWGPFRS